MTRSEVHAFGFWCAVRLFVWMCVRLCVSVQTQLRTRLQRFVTIGCELWVEWMVLVAKQHFKVILSPQFTLFSVKNLIASEIRTGFRFFFFIFFSSFLYSRLPPLQQELPTRGYIFILLNGISFDAFLSSCSLHVRLILWWIREDLDERKKLI